MVVEAASLACIVIGVFFMFVASLGILRLRGFYQRVHAPTKASTLGLISLLLGTALSLPEKAVVAKSILAVLFLFATAPAGAHILVRAAHRSLGPQKEERGGAP